MVTALSNPIKMQNSIKNTDDTNTELEVERTEAQNNILPSHELTKEEEVENLVAQLCAFAPSEDVEFTNMVKP